MQDNEKCGSAPDRISDNELRSMVKKATQGPWFIGKIDPDRGIWIGGRSEKDGGAVLPYLAIVKTINWPENFIHNGAMIAQAPALAAEVLELRALRQADVDRIDQLERELALQNRLMQDAHDGWKIATDQLAAEKAMADMLHQSLKGNAADRFEANAAYRKARGL